MTGTIEKTNNIICEKINSLKKLLNMFIDNSLKIEKCYEKELNDIEQKYRFGSIKVLTDYYELMNNYNENFRGNKSDTDKNKFISDKSEYFQQYQIFIRKQNFISKLDRLYNIFKNKIQILLQKNNICIKNNVDIIKNIFHTYENNIINKTISRVKYDICPNCSINMNVLSSQSELICKNCGFTETLYGTVFEDEQFFYQEGQRTKHGSYDPSKHCRFWVDRIQARETTEIPKKVIDDIKKSLKVSIGNIDDITCRLIRKFLRRTQNSKYNEHIPLIRKIITGITPPQLTDEELQLINIYFDKVIKIYEDIKPSNTINCFYHPYFIYKIIEHLLKNGSKMRLAKILQCIHLQSRETLIKNDKIWKKICEHITEIEYVPTDRNSQYDIIY